MNRIILGMAGANFLLAAVAAYLGLLADVPKDPNHPGNGLFFYHLILGIFTALFTMLTNCLVFTYFLGTSRWVKETSMAYHLDSRFFRMSQRLRLRSMAIALIGILLTVLTVASGAGAHTRVWPTIVHQVVPAITFTFLFIGYRIQYHAIEAHIDLTEKVMEEVNAIRRERGLPVDELATV